MSNGRKTSFIGICSAFLLCLPLASTALFADGNAHATGLKVNAMNSPLAVPSANPRLSWSLSPDAEDARNIIQTAYEIQAASSEKLLDENAPNLWSSGRQSSGNQTADYSGKIPPTGTPVFWRVRVWTNGSNEAGKWSAPQVFEFGPLKEEDWTGPWIAMDKKNRERHAPYFRKKIEFEKEIKSARAYVCGLGWFQLYVNGKKIGDSAFDPPQTDYDIRCMYAPFDIGAELNKKSGMQNEICVLVGDGWYNQDLAFKENNLAYGEPRLRAQLLFTFEDGTRQSVPADLTWETRKSPIVSSNVYGGEIYDANLELSRAEMRGREGWEPVVEESPPGGIMTAVNLQPERIIRELKPLSVKKKDGGGNVWVYDFGENISGRVKLCVRAEKGAKIKMRFAEKTRSDGTVDNSTCGDDATGVTQTDIYIAKGKGRETWEPAFTYHGFQYMEMTVEGGLKDEPDENTATAAVIHTDLPLTGSFDSSDENLNRLHKVAVQTYLMCAHALPADCPVRERCGWTGDAHTTARMAMMNFDAAAFLRKYSEDIETGGRKPNSEPRFIDVGELDWSHKPANVPHMIAPGRRRSGQATPDWGCAAVFIPWQIYCSTGDESVIKEMFPLFENWVAYLLAITDENGLLNSGFGDWCAPTQSLDQKNHTGNLGENPIVSTAMFIETLGIVSKSSKILGDNEKAEYYAKLAKNTSLKLTEVYWKSEDISKRTQTALSLTLLYTRDKSKNAELFEELLRKTENGEKFTTGVYGTPAMFEVLNRHGRHDIAHKLLTKESYPSYRAMLDMGVSTLLEYWPNNANLDSYGGSMSHQFHGAYDEWIYASAGIDGRRNGSGPWPFTWRAVEGLDRAEAAINPPAGKIASSWTREGGNVRWKIEIPANQQALIRIPSKPESIKESGKSLADIQKEQAKWLHKADIANDDGGNAYTQILAGSGVYEFEFTTDRNILH